LPKASQAKKKTEREAKVYGQHKTVPGNSHNAKWTVWCF
jgi:hypothetical protein